MTSPSRRFLTASSLLLMAGHATAQCPGQALYEFGGQPGPICSAGFGFQVDYEAVARGRWVSIESVPTVSGAPAFQGRIALDHPAIALYTEISGRVWASDGPTLYAINTGTPTAPQILGRITLPNNPQIDRLRVRGNYVYAVSASDLYIIDATNPAAPVLRSTFRATPSPWLNDVEVVGSYAYLSIEENPPVNSILVVDISNPTAPAQVGRVGNANRYGDRLSKAPNLSGLYALAHNSAAAAVELWSLTNPASPSITAVNATVPGPLGSGDDLRASNTVVSVYDTTDYSLRLFSPSNLATIGQPTVFSFTDEIQGMGSDSPFVFLTRGSGELARINVNTTPPTVIGSYFEVDPGVTYSVATLNEGFSVLTNYYDLWVFATPASGTPHAVAHIKPDPSYHFGPQVALVSGGTLFIVEYFNGTPSASRILAYQVTPSGLTWQGLYNVSGGISAIEAGADSSGAARLYYTLWNPSGPGTLRTLNATNVAAMTQMSSFALTTGVGRCLKYLSGNIFTGAPPRVLVGGSSGATQIVNVASSGSPSVLGVIPSSAQVISNGLIPSVWLLDNDTVRGFNISTPATPVLQSSIRIAGNGWTGNDIKPLDPFARILGVVTAQGDLVKVDVQSPTAPSLIQIARINSARFFGSVNGLAYDGTNIHIANGGDGYTILPYNISAPPREDPNHTLRMLGPQGIVPICPGAPLSLTAQFIASPAITGYQWLKYNRTTSAYEPLMNGPTPTGSVISGATTATLTVSGAAAGDIGYYQCRATNTCGTTTTDTIVEARLGGYANCDNSTLPPVLNINDFVCFLNLFTSSPNGFDGYVNCDGSTTYPNLNISDFICFQQRFAAGCP